MWIDVEIVIDWGEPCTSAVVILKIDIVLERWQWRDWLALFRRANISVSRCIDLEVTISLVRMAQLARWTTP